MNPLVVVGVIVSLLVASGVTVLKPIQSALNSEPAKQTSNIEFSPVSYKPAPQKKSGSKDIIVGASSALIYDVSSGQNLLEKNTNQKLPMASLTKLMTALVILENHKLDETITIPDMPKLAVEDQQIGISAGEQFRVADLLKALLIYSGDDVANALAIWDAGSLDKFTAKMNQKASDWGMSGTHFNNPSGLDTTDHYTSVADLKTLTGLLLHNQAFDLIVQTRATSIKNSDGRTYNLTTTNKLLGNDGVKGIKTGYTIEAGECLVTLAERNGQQIVTVVLNSPDRFQESKNMIDWAFTNYIWQ